LGWELPPLVSISFAETISKEKEDVFRGKRKRLFAVERISENPDMYPHFAGGMRRYLLQRFPFYPV
jgi:hypothetical protein